MSRKKQPASKGGNQKKNPVPKGVWNRGAHGGPANPIRVRTKRLEEIDDDKIALAYWLLAKRIAENGSDRQVTEDEARRVASELDDDSAAEKPGGGR